MIKIVRRITGLLYRPFRRMVSFIRKMKVRYIQRDCRSLGQNPMIGFPICLHGLGNVSIGSNFIAGERLKLRTFNSWEGVNYTPNIVIGNNVNIETDCHISAINEVVIEDNVLIASYVYISDHAHGEMSLDVLKQPPIERLLVSKGSVKICKNVWLGEKVTILPGVTVGEGSVIGANSVVTHNIPPYSVAVGVPAKVIKSFQR